MKFRQSTNTSNEETIPDSDVQKLHAAEITLSDKLAALRAALAEAEAEAGEEALSNILDSGTERSAARRVNSIRSEISASERAIDAARMRRKAAILDEYQAQAIPLRRDAANKRNEATKRQRTTDDLLSKLREFEGVEYAPYQGANLTPMRGDMIGGAPLMRIIATSKTDMLVLEAQTLDAQADAWEAKAVREHGQIEGDAETVLATIRQWDAYMIAPSLPSVSAWIEAVTTPLRERVARMQSDHQERAAIHYHVVFHGGVIDSQHSEATIIDTWQHVA